ncbi:MAG: type II toxin-antitoxin system VapC family toxin [Candidatus Bathyarchaeia archaeon]|jgi:predicted nucleic acid-binding protein
MPYIDANVFIYPILYAEEQEPKVKYAKQILLSIEKGELSAYTSTLTWDEVVWITRKAMGRDEAISQGQKLLGFLNLQWILVDEHILSQAQALMNKYNLHPRDSIHVASAISRKINLIISDDLDIDQVKEIKRTPLL